MNLSIKTQNVHIFMQLDLYVYDNDNNDNNDNENFIPDTFVHKNIHWSILTFLRYINTIL